jgi:hypothetical protein
MDGQDGRSCHLTRGVVTRSTLIIASMHRCRSVASNVARLERQLEVLTDWVMLPDESPVERAAWRAVKRWSVGTRAATQQG